VGNALEEESASMGMGRLARRRPRLGLLSVGSNPLRRQADRIEARISPGCSARS